MLLIGQRLAVKGVWDETPTPDGRRDILLNPSITTFGNGYHPSTRTFLTHLEAGQVTPGMSVLDIGTGTGILAIAAALLGSTDVWAVDTNPGVIETTWENCRSSGVRDVVTVAEELPGSEFDTSGAPPGTEFDLVVCNIDKLEVARDALRYVKPGGLCAVSVQATDQVMLQSMVSGFGLEVAEPLQRWVYLAFRRQAGG